MLVHIPSTKTLWSLQKQPLVQGDSSLHLLTPITSLQDKFQLHSRYSVPAGQAIEQNQYVKL